MRIVLDPGHGQYGNPGVIKPYHEGTQMYKLAYFLKSELEKYGANVLVTRKNLSDDLSLTARGKMAKGYDLFISLHSNAPGEAAKKDGTYNSIKGTNVYDSVNRPTKSLADKLGQAIANVMGHKYRGTKYRRGNNVPDYYTVLQSAFTVGCKSAMLIEHGYHTNPDDCTFLLKDENLKRIAQAEAEVIAEYYKLQLKTPKPEPKPNPNMLYRVQTGAFSKKANADARFAEIKKAGFDAYMVQHNGLYKVQVGAYGVKANADAMATKLKAKGFDVYITTQAGSPVVPTPEFKPTPKPEPKPQPTPKAKQTWEHYINGAIVKELQLELNKQFHAKLNVDGYFGDETINALVVVRRGAKGSLTKIIQKRLGIDDDGVFGAKTEKAIRAFQKARRLQIDGVVGKETWKALFRK